jgi:hypothetical protein
MTDAEKMLASLRARREELLTPYAFIDAVGGFSRGYSERVLSGRAPCSMATFDILCELLAVSLTIAPDPDKQSRMAVRWENFNLGTVAPIRRRQRSATAQRAANARWHPPEAAHG